MPRDAFEHADNLRNRDVAAGSDCAIANVNVAGMDPVAIGSYLFNKHRIFTTPIVHDEFKGIRITPNVYTTLGELDRFCNVIEMVARKGPQILSN